MDLEKHYQMYDVVVVGSGLTGMAAGFFASGQGLRTAVVGMTGGIHFASGLLDLLGVHCAAGQTMISDPWPAMAELARTEPGHPYGLLQQKDMRLAITRFIAWLADAGYPHVVDPHGKNQLVLTAMGTIKPTYAVPHTLYPGVRAMAEKKPCLLVDFEGLKGYGARQIAATLGGRWPGIKTVRLKFPETSGELYPERMAYVMETRQGREALARAVKPHLGEARVVGFPAMLGIRHTVTVMKELQLYLSRPVFEIPTMPPAATGVRLNYVMAHQLPAVGVQTFFQQRVAGYERLNNGVFLLHMIAEDQTRHRIAARAVVLATGRFFGKGLRADRHGLHEALFNLPVVFPANRSLWHHKDFFHPDGHLINRSGLLVDHRFRPMTLQGNVVHDNLFAAGAILANQDWVRQKCGGGLAITTAWGAVMGCKDGLG